jgi:phosphoribosylglycinamide formyltransferase-1
MPAPPLKIGVLGSGKGSNFAALHQAICDGKVLAETVLVASDQPEAGILDFAERHELPRWTTPPSRFKTRLEPEIETQLATRLKEAGVELVVLAGFMRVIKKPLLDAFPRAIINIHPSLLPDFKGLEAWKQALEAGVPETGCTVHWVDDSLDGGDIISQRRVPVLPDDTATSLHARIQTEEHRLLPEVVDQLARSWER